MKTPECWGHLVRCSHCGHDMIVGKSGAPGTLVMQKILTEPPTPEAVAEEAIARMATSIMRCEGTEFLMTSPQGARTVIADVIRRERKRFDRDLWRAAILACGAILLVAVGTWYVWS